MELWRRETNHARPLNEPPPSAEEPGVVLGNWATLAEAHEHALVVLAMRRDCWIEAEPDGYALLAEAADQPAITAELAIYAAEKVEQAQQAEQLGRAMRAAEALAVAPASLAAAASTLLWALLLVGVFFLQQDDPLLSVRFNNYNLAIFNSGEWWRPFTALFLHADAGHLLGNAALGGLLCLWAAETLGPWRAWPRILLAGTAGNLLTGWIAMPEAHASLGASTATFAALGILVGTAVRHAWRTHSYRHLRGLLVPLCVGILVLSIWGAGDAQTDVLGHVAGFVCGAMLGGGGRQGAQGAKGVA